MYHSIQRQKLPAIKLLLFEGCMMAFGLYYKNNMSAASWLRSGLDGDAYVPMIYVAGTHKATAGKQE